MWIQLVVILVFCGLATSARAESAFDDFERHDLGPSWTAYFGSSPGIVGFSDLAVPDLNWLFVGWTAQSFGADQYSEATISDAKPANMMGQVYVRRQALARYAFHYNVDPGNAYWEIKFDGVPSEQTRILATNPSVPPPAANDLIRIEAQGENPVTIRGYLNEQLVLTATDGAPDRIDVAGEVGVVARLATGTTATTPIAVFEDWGGGDLDTSIAIPMLGTTRRLVLGALLLFSVLGLRRFRPCSLFQKSRSSCDLGASSGNDRTS